MGSSGLHKLVAPKTRRVRLRDHCGGRIIGVDASWLLHSVGNTHGNDIGQEQYGALCYSCFHKLQKLRNDKLSIVVVFDGEVPPSKLATVHERRKTQTFVRTWDMQRQLILYLRQKEIECIVAPYEAESQLVYMQRMKQIDIIMGYDSDYIALGCDAYVYDVAFHPRGVCASYWCIDAYQRLKFTDAEPNAGVLQRVHAICAHEAFQLWSIVAGCDYIAWNGVGAGKCGKILSQALQNNTFDTIAIARLLKAIGGVAMDEHDIVKFLNDALANFRAPIVFDIAQGKRVLLDGSRYSERRNATQGVVKCLFDAVAFARGDVNVETGASDDSEFQGERDAVKQQLKTQPLQTHHVPGNTFAPGVTVNTPSVGKEQIRTYFQSNGLKAGFSDPPASEMGTTSVAVPVDEKLDVHHHQQMTKMSRIMGREPTVRDPKGRNNAQLFALYDKIYAQHFPDGLDDVKPPSDAEPWDGLNVIARTGAVLPESVIEYHVLKSGEYGHAVNWESVMKKAKDRLLSQKDWRSAKMWTPHKSCAATHWIDWFRVSIDPSEFQKKPRRVYLGLAVFKRADRNHRPHVRDIVYGICDCIAACGGAQPFCVHCIIAAYAFATVDRGETEPTCTGVPAAWKIPTSGVRSQEQFDEYAPLHRMPLRSKRKASSDTPNTHGCQETKDPRVAYKVYSDDAALKIRDMNVTDVRNEFFEALFLARGKRVCAYEQALACRTGEHHEYNPLMMGQDDHA